MLEYKVRLQCTSCEYQNQAEKADAILHDHQHLHGPVLNVLVLTVLCWGHFFHGAARTFCCVMARNSAQKSQGKEPAVLIMKISMGNSGFKNFDSFDGFNLLMKFSSGDRCSFEVHGKSEPFGLSAAIPSIYLDSR